MTNKTPIPLKTAYEAALVTIAKGPSAFSRDLSFIGERGPPQRVDQTPKKLIREDPVYQVAKMLHEDADSAYYGTPRFAPENAKGRAMQRAENTSIRLERIGRELARKGLVWSRK